MITLTAVVSTQETPVLPACYLQDEHSKSAGNDSTGGV